MSEAEQEARTGTGSQNWNREPELEQGARTGAGHQNWCRAPELEQGDMRWSSRTVGGGDIVN